jgi:hypothetical protein
MRKLLVAMASVGSLTVVSLGVVSSAAGADPVPAIFGPRAVYTVGVYPSSVEVADLDGDSVLDLVVGNQGSASVSVLIGDGTGGFGPQGAFATGPTPTSVAVGDANGDAVPDLATANFDSSTVSVLLGDGAGGFAPHQDFAAGASTAAVALADVNGDSLTDLITANYDDYSASVLLGDGHGGFGLPAGFATGAAPTSVAVGDVNGDSFLDLATANSGSDTVTVLLGDGVGGFGARTDLVTGPGPYFVALRDLNGDSGLDVVAARPAGNVSVLLGDGAGGFGARDDFAIGAGAWRLAVGDVNGDSFPDLMTANSGSGSVSVLLGDGIGAFSARTDVGVPGAFGVAVGELNGDSRLDLAVSSFEDGVVSVLLNGGAASVPGAPTTPVASAFDQRATVSWGAPSTNGGLGITGYEVTPYIDGVAQSPVTFSSTATTQTITGLTNGTTYTFTVAARNPVGLGPASGASNPVTPAAPLPTAPTAPTIIRNATAGHQSATIAWLAPTSDGGSPLTGYLVTPYIDLYPLPPITFDATATTQTITGLTNGIEYRFRVRAVNAIGTSGYSKVTNPVTPSLTAPSSPTIVANATAGDGEATLSWIVPASDGGSAITTYVVTPYIGYYPLSPITFDASVTTRTVTGLTNGTQYRFRVQAINAIGTSGYSKVTNPVTPTG